MSSMNFPPAARLVLSLTDLGRWPDSTLKRKRNQGGCRRDRAFGMSSLACRRCKARSAQAVTLSRLWLRHAAARKQARRPAASVSAAAAVAAAPAGGRVAERGGGG